MVRAMDMLDALAGLDLDSTACQQAGAAAALAPMIQQPEAGLQSGSLLQEVQGSRQPLLQGGSGTAADCNVAGGLSDAQEEGTAAQINEDAGAISALQQEQSVHNPFSRSSAIPQPSHGDSVGAEVEHLKQVRLGFLFLK